MSERLMFIARESARLEGGSEDGLSWPIQVMQAGFAHGEVMTTDPQFSGLPHYFPKEVVAQVAEACKSARFGRRHPQSLEEETDANRMAGWLDGGRMEGNAARATMHLFENEKDLQAKLLSARKARQLDLFGTSILAYFLWRRGTAEGRDALVAQRLGRLVSVDMVTEAGASGKFLLPYAASLRGGDLEFGGEKVQTKPKRPVVDYQLDSQDRLQLATDLMLGVKEGAGKGLRGFDDLADCYRYCSGDLDFTEFTKSNAGMWTKTSQAISTSNFPNILLNSMTKKLIQDFEDYPLVKGLEKIYTPADFRDFKPQDRVRMGYLADLPTVTEASAFTELTPPTDEKINYLVSKYGGMFTISEETIRNNDLGRITLFIERQARAARHTLCTFITNFFITPPAYDPDSLAWFHATHNNLYTATLATAALDAQAIVLAKQTEKDSGNRLGLTLDWIMIPPDLLPTALLINRSMTGTGATVGANGWREKFGENDENIIINPLLTDVDDWFGGCFPVCAPFLEIGFLDGIDTPQLHLVSGDPRMDASFTNDQIRAKVSFVFGGKPIDFRGVFENKID